MKSFSKLSAPVLLIMILGCNGCKKNTDDSTPIVLPDNILYTDVEPDTSVTSIREWVNYYYSWIPVPSDSSATIYFDLDQDGIMDVVTGAYTHYDQVSVSNPEVNYTFGSGFGMVRDTDSVAWVPPAEPCYCAKPFLPDSVIFIDSHYAEGATTSSKYTFAQPCSCNAFSGDTYFGMKMFRSGGYCYGWILMSYPSSGTLIVKEYAINLTPGKPIKAGQKE